MPSTRHLVVATDYGAAEVACRLLARKGKYMVGENRWLEVEPVLMTDGRIVDFPGKRRIWKSSYLNGIGRVCVRLDFRNGVTRTITLRPDMMSRYAAHGAEQKLGAEFASVKDIDKAVSAVDELIAQLDKGEWSKKRGTRG